ncbi:MAG: (Na+)-NQR maturation NqrM [Kangiellaceae bacterium]|nr:(Na+)-NQR maturation NqrM [Kangiellaceae bacterium]MCW9017397.1 (Na+)-NQR maturation NqrM [Kangiellaceae bacterium]
MELFLITFVLMLIVIMIMAVGYIFQRKKIKGSCGGISDLGLEKVCDCDEPCDKRKELMRKLEEQRKEEAKLNGTAIDVRLIEEE